MAVVITAAAPVFAEWSFFGTSTMGDSWYIERDTIYTNINKRRVWTLHDMKKINKVGTRSLRVLYEVDCLESRYRTLKIVGYKGKMGDGETNGIDNSLGEWEYSVPGSMVGGVVEKVC